MAAKSDSNLCSYVDQMVAEVEVSFIASFLCFEILNSSDVVVAGHCDV